MNPTRADIIAAYTRKGYAFFSEASPFNLNLWGIRKRTNRVNFFDDVLGLTCTDATGASVHLIQPATVDPGLYYLKDKLLNSGGTFVLSPGQYRGCWQKGMHKGQYPALVQKNGYQGFKGWRDNRLDGKIERRLDASGHFFINVTGMNMHRSSETFASVVGPFSVGCQVRQRNADHLEVMTFVDQAIARFGNSFSYTLFDEEEVFPVLNLINLIDSLSVDDVGDPGLTQPPLTLLWPDAFMKVEKPQ